MAKARQWPSARVNDEGRLEIRVNAIRPMKNQPRRVQLPEEVQALTVSIEVDGPEEPIKVIPLKRAKGPVFYELVSGETRWLGHKEAKKTWIWAIIDEKIKDRKSQLRAAIRSNANRRGLRGLETAYAIKEMLDQGCTKEEIRRDFGFTSVFPIDQALGVLRLPDEILHLMWPHETNERVALSVAFAYELSKMPRDQGDLRDEIAFAVHNGEMRGQRALLRVREVTRSSGGRVRRKESPKRDSAAFENHIERMSDVLQRYLDFPQEHIDKIVGAYTKTSRQIVLDQLDLVADQVKRLRTSIQKSAKKT